MLNVDAANGNVAKHCLCIMILTGPMNLLNLLCWLFKEDGTTLVTFPCWVILLPEKYRVTSVTFV